MSSFSVLMSVYYKEQALYLKEALDSIWLNQILKPDQIVLVEDGPLTPELYEVIDEFQKEVGNVLTLVKNETNQGLAKALNKGIGFNVQKANISQEWIVMIFRIKGDLFMRLSIWINIRML